MARSRRSRRQNNRRNSRPRRRNRRRMNNNNLSTAPPRLLITSNTRRLLIPYGYDVLTNSDRRDITIKHLMSYEPNIGLTFEFREIKIHRVQVFWQSDNGTTDAGSVCLVVGDYGENQASDTVPFHQAVTYPGAMVRKVWQNVSNVWFPTEPSDRNWFDIMNQDGLLTVTVRHSVEGSKLKGRILFLCNVGFRGRNNSKCPPPKVRELWRECIAQWDNSEQRGMHGSPMTEGFERLELEPGAG